MLLETTRRELRRLKLSSKKRLGQHFLVDEEVLETIVHTADLTESDTVIEIGPGLGVLSREIARRVGRLIAVELDDRLASILRSNMARFANTTVINDNILNTEPASLIELSQQRISAATPYKVVANLPYYITSAVIRHFLDTTLKPGLIVVMVQKEVAEAITAEPGRMSLLAISVQLYARAELVEYVPARCFYPVPEVDSALIKLASYPAPALKVNEEGFFNLVRAGFTASRKQICNSLARGLGMAKENICSRLSEAGIAKERRAETLSLEEWGELWRVFDRWGKGD
ncbi:MAG: 16S rRNA (adenine(1518)-N(6)/adenine(1519)-N(6))-dimethyltransferase RsmA [Dehalococcoidales bacterium]